MSIPQIRPLAALLAALLVALLAACTAASSPTPEPTPTPTPTPEATPSPTEGEAGGPSLEPGAGELAALLPSEVGGITLEYQSASGAEVMGSEGITPEAQAFFDRVGAEPSELSSAFGFGFDVEAGSGLSIVAFRVQGADEGRLRDEFRAVLEQEGNTVNEAQVGGKSVLAFATDPETPGGYLYVKGDVIFIVAGEPPEIMEEAIGSLP